MKDQLISFKTALLAKLKGFDTHSKSYFGATGLPHRSKQHLTQNSIKMEDVLDVLNLYFLNS